MVPSVRMLLADASQTSGGPFTVGTRDVARRIRCNGRIARLCTAGSGDVGVRGAVAQMGERCNRTAEVKGSIPFGSTSATP